MLGTFVEVTVPEEAASAIDAAFAAIAHVERRMSFHSDESDLARLRRAPIGMAVRVAPETVEVFGIASELHHASQGLFDVTVGRELVHTGFLPRPCDFARADEWGNATDIEILNEYQVRCQRPVWIDLGGIAKGFAVDRAVSAMRHAGAQAGLVNAGGDLRMFGSQPWPVGLRDADGTVRSEVSLTNCAVASSANKINRKRRWGRTSTPHIGAGRKPMKCNDRVTVVAERCVIADAMTKVAMADPALASRLLAERGGYLLAH